MMFNQKATGVTVKAVRWVINMNSKEHKQNSYNEARKEKIIASLQALDAETVCANADSIFFESFETPAERWTKTAKSFHDDIVPF